MNCFVIVINLFLIDINNGTIFIQKFLILRRYCVGYLCLSKSIVKSLHPASKSTGENLKIIDGWQNKFCDYIRSIT